MMLIIFINHLGLFVALLWQMNLSILRQKGSIILSIKATDLNGQEGIKL